MGSEIAPYQNTENENLKQNDCGSQHHDKCASIRTDSWVFPAEYFTKIN